MPPKAGEKKPSTGGKAPAGGKAPVEKKEAGKKTAAPSGDKKKRNKARKETYSSYIYKGILVYVFFEYIYFLFQLLQAVLARWQMHSAVHMMLFVITNTSF